MKSSTLQATLQRLNITPSSRPQLFKDNAISESLFRPCKYRIDYSTDGYIDLSAAQQRVVGFVQRYNHKHHHSPIPLAERQADQDVAVARCYAIYAEAQQARTVERVYAHLDAAQDILAESRCRRTGVPAESAITNGITVSSNYHDRRSQMSLILWEVPDFFIDQEFQTENIRGCKKVAIIPDTGRSVGRMPLLYREDGTGITVANNWLIHLKVNLNKKEVNTQAQGLLHYFTFLENINYSWDFMPAAVRQRPTYAFKKHLREAFKNRVIARSTANSYMSVVIRFYKFYLARNHRFENPPFNYEFVKVELPGRHDFMNNKILHVDSTDLRLQLPKDYKFNGLARSLVPLSKNEWSLLDDFLKSGRRGIVKKTSGSVSVPLSIELKLAVYLARFSGLRREEIITLRSKQIYRPDKEQLSKKYLIHTEGLLLDPRWGVSTKNGSIRHAEIPSALMNELHKYLNSPRYIERKRKFILKHPDKADNPPLLINQRGSFFSSKTLDARWGEIRNAFSSDKIDFEHKFHNLRSTYAVFRLEELLNTGLNESEALDYLQAVMGHKHRTALLAYLKFSKQVKSANQVYEEAIEIILKG